MTYNDEKKLNLHMRFIKNYKKNTAAVFLSFMLTFMLLTVMLVLIHTNFQISSIQSKTEFSPSDCYIDGLSEKQLNELRKDSDIEWMGVQQGEYHSYGRNNQVVLLAKNDSEAITMMAKIMEGRLPEAKGEIVAEKWALLNLGIEPIVNQVIEIVDSDTGKPEKVCVTGILSDIYANKKYGLLSMYTVLEQETSDTYMAYLEFKESVNYHEKVDYLQAKLKLESGKITERPEREDMKDLYILDTEITCIILLLCMVVFYGIYRIATLSRISQYGVLRAIGLKKGQLQKMIWKELYSIYLISVPIGIALGIFVAYIVMFISGDKDAKVYLHNKMVQFKLVIPGWQIFICIAITGILIGCIGYTLGKQVVRLSVIDTIASNLKQKKEEKDSFDIQKADSKIGMLFRMGCKYIVRDLKTSGFVILNICVGIVLFTGLAYKADTLKIYREDTKEMYYLNGQYAMTMQYFDQIQQGVSRESMEKILGMNEIVSAKTSSSMPIRVIDEENISRNDKYYNKFNKNLKKIYGYSDVGFDGKDQIYKSMLSGYNTDALRVLKQYVIEGNFEPENMREDEVILFILHMDNEKKNGIPKSIKEGTPLMEYHAGDKIRVKYREDGQTNLGEYELLTDYDAKYHYKTYKVAAIVSFSYMYDCNKTVYPLLITSDQYIQKIVPESSFQCIYWDGVKNITAQEQIMLERDMIRIGSQNNNVSTRSMISEIEQNEMFYYKQLVYIYGIAIIAFILVLVNMINNLRYRMQTRTREICMLRAVGFSVSMIQKMILFENVILGSIATFLAFIFLQPILRYLYTISEMKAFAHEFHFDYVNFTMVTIGAILICILLSFRILKAWKSKEIIKGIGSFE